ncbi:MAG: MFS transporter, partial [Phycisphaerales bacterium]|nr:MFS transporter [Phycisphaerales bacterium]
AISLMKRPSFAVLIVCSFLLCIPLAAYYSWGGVFVGDQGIEKIAQTMSYGQMAEVVFMLLMPLFFAALGAKWMLAVGMLAWVIRYGLFAGAAACDETVMWMIIGGIALHGICYDFFFVTGQIYVDKVAPAQVRGQAQGFLVLVTQGLGMLIGAQVAAELVKSSTDTDTGARDWVTIWIVPCVMAAVFMFAFVALFRDRSSGTDATLPDPVPEGTPPE